jgi:hypothetical protein
LCYTIGLKWAHVEIGGGVGTGTLHCGVVMKAAGGGADMNTGIGDGDWHWHIMQWRMD